MGKDGKREKKKKRSEDEATAILMQIACDPDPLLVTSLSGPWQPESQPVLNRVSHKSFAGHSRS